MTRFGTLWKGPSLSAFEASCLYSFVGAGHQVTLFSYEPVVGVPAGIKRADAAPIGDAAWLNAFLLNGVPSIAHFSDLFRYRMFERTELTWIDADLLLLRSWDQDPNQTLLALETPHSLNGAVMRVPSQERWLSTLIEQSEALRGRSIRWGETGPRLVTRVAGTHAGGAQAAPPLVYFPIPATTSGSPFCPNIQRSAARCARKHARCTCGTTSSSRWGTGRNTCHPQAHGCTRCSRRAAAPSIFAASFRCATCVRWYATGSRARPAISSASAVCCAKWCRACDARFVIARVERLPTRSASGASRPTTQSACMGDAPGAQEPLTNCADPNSRSPALPARLVR